MGRRSNRLNTLAGAAAAGIVVVMLCEIMLSSVPGGDVIPETVVDWFALLEHQPFIGLRNLGLLNIASVLLGIPITFALYALLRRTHPDAAALAAITGYLGTVVFLATNRAFPMWSLSQAYAAASSGAEQRALLAAGQALLAVGASHTPGTFLGFFLSSVAAILNAALMLRSRAFGKVTGYLGLVGMPLLFLFDTGVSFFPALWDTLMIVAMIGGLSSITWYGFVARDLIAGCRKR
jgi:hypothetical protein